MKGLKSILRNRLRSFRSEKYVKYRLSKKPEGFDLDHILESVHGRKLNDYLLDTIPHSSHMVKHYPKPGDEQTEDEFIESLIKSLNELFEYTSKLEKGEIK